MKVTVVTVCFNSVDTVRRAIDSVLTQTHKDLEYIIIDGGSSDGTVETVRSYGAQIQKFVSEPDRGLYDAMNKGWRLASGDVVGFLNSDDLFSDRDSVRWIVQAFSDSGASAVYGDLDLVARDGRVVRHWRSGGFDRRKYHLGWMTPHPATYVRRSLLQRHGGFRNDLPISADYELMLRFFYRYRAPVTYLPRTLVKMQAGGMSNSSVRSILSANLQVYRSWRINNLVTSPTIVLTKPLSKLFQLRM